MDISRVPWKLVVLIGCGLFLFVQPDYTVNALITAIGLDPKSPNGIRLNGLFHLVGMILVMVGGRRLYNALNER
jgi:hypothetical protein